jgi:GDP-D-mannose dehydratase
MFNVGSPKLDTSWVDGPALMTSICSWEGSSIDEVAKRVDTGEIVVLIDPEEYHRPSHDTHGDPRRAISALGWKQEKTFEVSCSSVGRGAHATMTDRVVS